MIISFSPPNDLELAGSSEELAAISDRVERLQPGEHLVVACSTAGDPSPYASHLRQLRIEVAHGPVAVSVRDEVLNISGSLLTIQAFASFLVFHGEQPGMHNHFEYFEGNEFISPTSIPLVIACRGAQE